MTKLLSTVDWSWVLTDVRDATGAPLDLTGAVLRVRFRPVYDYSVLIADLHSGVGGGITITPGGAGLGPTIAILCRAAPRVWTTPVPTQVEGDLNMTTGSGADALVGTLARIAFDVTPGT